MKPILIALCGLVSTAAIESGATLQPFPGGARVAFFGDSITRNGGAMLRVAAHYRTAFPDRDVRFYNVGISGGGLEAAGMYFDKYLAAAKPTHVVLAFGVNDSGALRIDGSAADANAEKKRVEEAATAFRVRYAALVGRIEALGAKVILRIPTPYNEFGEGTAPSEKGKNDSYRRVGDEIRSFAREKGLPFVDDYVRMSKCLSEGETVFSGDRVHPNDYGQWRMAETLLAAQGQKIAAFRPQGEVTAASGLAAWFAQSQKLADILSGEWLLVRDETLGLDAKLDKVRTWLDTKGAEPNANQWVVGLARRYLDDKPHEDAIRAAMDAAWDARLKTIHELDEFPVSCEAVSAVEGREASLLPKGKKFKLVWNDEFDGDRLDETKWGYRTNFWGRSAHWFAKPEDNAVEVKDGLLRLRLVKRPDGQFVSPQLQTGELLWDIPHEQAPKGFWPLPKRDKAKFMHRYGYYECRCRLQQMPGWWSAFWMQTPMQGCSLDPRRAGIEHDIMESFEPGEIIPHCFHANGYGADYQGFRCPRVKVNEDAILALDKTKFHVFGMLWEPDGYTLYVDGRQHGPKVGCGEGEAVSQTEEFILLTTEAKWYRNDRMTGNGVPELDAAAASGDDFVVDYVRVYDMAE